MHKFRHFYCNILKLWTHEFDKCDNTVKLEFAFLAHWGRYISADFESVLKLYWGFIPSVLDCHHAQF